MAIQINKEALEKACKEIIDTILICLPNAFKGTVYRIGRPPEMIAKRITSGVIDEERSNIAWGLPEKSDYNPPGKPFKEYRDEPGRPLEAMAWCVERQESWTAEDPKNDARSIRLQVEGVWADFHHMEPVLIRKSDLYFGNGPHLEYPRNYNNQLLWENSDYIVAAVIKIHFRPYTIKIGGPETRVVKKLSRALGTELLSYQLSQHSLEAIQHLAEDRLNSCNILADSLRNVITKYGLIFSLIKLELGFLRDQWERVVLERSDQKEMRGNAIHALNEAARGITGSSDGPGGDLINIQNRFLDLHLPPEQGAKWLRMQIEEKWNTLIHEGRLEAEAAEAVRHEIDNLKRSLYLGKDPELLAAYNMIPEDIKTEWVELLYKDTDTDTFDLQLLDRLVHILDDSYLNLPYKDKSRKSLIRLKAVAEIIRQMEEKTNVVLREVLNGHHEETIPTVSVRKPV
ncbi:MAG: hypothetical protein ISR62_03685 [Desulfobacteraceae bacterium]|nr:hypothetical protein [Desulfobacterales bacterium]MBL6967505.1 hypothetical protein [Desulfobacteraceae bacterium]MBL7173557.1 hypothetical protein [Desulfobacteraceae bacterium]